MLSLVMQLQGVGDRLEQAERADPVRADPVLEARRDFTLGPDHVGDDAGERGRRSRAHQPAAQIHMPSAEVQLDARGIGLSPARAVVPRSGGVEPESPGQSRDSPWQAPSRRTTKPDAHRPDSVKPSLSIPLAQA